MEKKYLAHLSDDGREQSLLDHLLGTAELCADFASAFDAREQGLLAGMAHDIGKYSDAFQRRLRGSSERVDHSTAGAKECFDRRQPYAAFSVAGHHSGLPNGGGRGDTSDLSTFRARMGRPLEPYEAWKPEVSLPAVPPLSPTTQAEAMFFTRMLYSCLVDADFLDTETFMAGAPTPRGGGASMEALEARLLSSISDWFPPEGPLNQQRCAILERCLEQGEGQAPGLFSLTVPTGGGKTVASLAFALRHAKSHGLRRVIYVIPYTSIIEQNAQVFRNILGDGNVLEHHSGLLYDPTENDSPEKLRLAKATENWDMPVVVTTAVQFFESLFANRSSKCRKLHNLARSVIIFDEAQMLPIPYLRPCVFAISQLVKQYHVSAVLCTATQPSLGPLFQEFLPDKPIVELCPPETYQGGIFRRVTFRREGRLSWDALAQKLNELPQALCIVNSRKSAQKIYDLLSPEGSFHLSTLMCPAHRKAALAEIHRRLDIDLPCRVVSTSLIEAGVDVDFPAVFREEAGLDSVLQAAGRCNREGKRSPEESIVTLFQSDPPAPSMFQMNIAACRQALAHADRPDSPDAIAYYFRELLALIGRQGQDKDEILALMVNSFMPFQTVAERFHLIKEDTQTIYVPWGQGATLIARLRKGEHSRTLFRALDQYGVSVCSTHFNALDRAGVLDILEDGCAILTAPALYSEATGLSMAPQEGNAFIL